MSKVNRARDRAVTVRMSDSEYDRLKNKVNESGLSQQSYIISAALDSYVTTSDTIDVLKTISKTFAGVEQQLRGLGTNVNQMAHIANGTGMTPSARELERISDQVMYISKTKKILKIPTIRMISIKAATVKNTSIEFIYLKMPKTNLNQLV